MSCITKPDTQHYADIAREQVNQTAKESAERIKRPYFRQVESFLYNIPYAITSLVELQMRYSEVETQRITGQYGGVVVSGGQASSKQERYVEIKEKLEREILKREQVIERYNLIVDHLKKVSNGEVLIKLLDLKYIKGFSNEATWNEIRHDKEMARSTFYEWRLKVVDTTYKVLPSQFLEEYK